MYCKYCGEWNPDDSGFCASCGKRIELSGVEHSEFEKEANERLHERSREKSRKKFLKGWIIVFIVLVLVCAIGAGIFFFVSSKRDQEDKVAGDRIEQEKDPQTEKEVEATDSSETKKASEKAKSEEDSNEEFGITPGIEANYKRNLNPEEYRYYHGASDEFSFYYPADLYENVTVNETPNKNIYGENVQAVNFTASDGSELIFSLSKRTDNLGIAEATSQIYEAECGYIHDSEVIVNRMKDDYGKIVLTGWADAAYDRTVYDMIKVEGEYVMQMKVVIPTYIDREDELQKGYFTECMYRMCGFSDAEDSYRSYSEYKEASNG